jgi:hypothetical protein
LTNEYSPAHTILLHILLSPTKAYLYTDVHRAGSASSPASTKPRHQAVWRERQYLCKIEGARDEGIREKRARTTRMDPGGRDSGGGKGCRIRNETKTRRSRQSTSTSTPTGKDTSYGGEAPVGAATTAACGILESRVSARKVRAKRARVRMGFLRQTKDERLARKRTTRVDEEPATCGKAAYSHRVGWT